MAKWRVKKSRESVDWLYPWRVIDDRGIAADFSTWELAMRYINRKDEAERKKWWRYDGEPF